METDEFVAHAPLDAEVLEAWIEAGWLLPRQDGAKRNFFDVGLKSLRICALAKI
jgi:hypothetical protein